MHFICVISLLSHPLSSSQSSDSSKKQRFESPEVDSTQAGEQAMWLVPSSVCDVPQPPKSKVGGDLVWTLTPGTCCRNIKQWCSVWDCATRSYTAQPLRAQAKPLMITVSIPRVQGPCGAGRSWPLHCGSPAIGGCLRGHPARPGGILQQQWLWVEQRQWRYLRFMHTPPCTEPKCVSCKHTARHRHICVCDDYKKDLTSSEFSLLISTHCRSGVSQWGCGSAYVDLAHSCSFSTSKSCFSTATKNRVVPELYHKLKVFPL